MSPRVVCFDLGGVLLDVCDTWDEALRQSGAIPAGQWRVPLTAIEPFVSYQAGALDDGVYLQLLAASLGVGPLQARRVHLGILRNEVEGSERLIATLHAHGVVTGCLSNTNALHWEVLVSDAYPAVRSLQVKVASHIERTSKPETAIYAAFEAAARATPGDILYFDDVEEYVESARERGWSARLVPPGSDKLGVIVASLTEVGILKHERPAD